MGAKTTFRRCTAILGLLTGLLAPAWSAPSVSSISGASFAHGQTAVVSGASFGSKSPAAPLIWADFESSLNPTALGSLTTWSSTKDTAREAGTGYNGTASAKGSGDVTGGVSYTLMVNDVGTDGAKHYVFRRTKLNHPLVTTSNGDQNVKIFRVWASGINYPNLYCSINNGRIFVEKDAPSDTGYYTGPINNFGTANVWHTEEHFVKQSSAINVKDGEYIYTCDGVQQCSGSIMSRFTAWSGQFTDWFIVHGVYSNVGNWANGGGNAWSNSNAIYSDDVYFDKTYSRVMVSNNATLSSATKLAVQIPSAWTTTSATVLLQLPSNDFPNASTAYVHVCDSNNSCSPGKAFTVAGSAVAAPTIVSVDKVYTSTSAGTTIVATCTGLSATLTSVTLGGTACTSVVRNSATQFTCVLPAKVAGAYDLVVTNGSDSQTGTLPNAVTTRNRPYVLTINPTSITTVGGNTVAFTATDLVSGSTIKVGTMTATGFAWVSSTAGSFVAPGMSAGVYDIQITGPTPDSQTTTKSGALTYTVPVSPTPDGRIFMWFKF